MHLKTVLQRYEPVFFSICTAGLLTVKITSIAKRILNVSNAISKHQLQSGFCPLLHAKISTYLQSHLALPM